MPAFPILSVSRKPILLFLFVTVFIFLYQIASHPKVSRTMQSSAYYTNYDERACLPQRVLDKNPPTKKAKAAIVILVRNKELEAIKETVINFQNVFNNNFDYPYVFLNEVPFTEEFKYTIRQAAPNASRIEFGLVPEAHWSYPSWHKKKYGFVVTLLENKNTIPSLWKTVQQYAKSRHIDISMPQSPSSSPLSSASSKRVNNNNHNKRLLFPYFIDPSTGDYNLCHFWSNFEIASLNLWRSPEYRDFFQYLDQTGNFFYERWGDAPVHSLAAGLFLSTDEIHYFEDIGYQHDLYRHCPTKESSLGCRCTCPEGTTDKSIDHDQYYDTCLPVWKQHVKHEKKNLNWNVWS
ncbi:nucleotide-diphospho-sugar transferase [Mycotypha africana]|uniref:nucleotide-diphospho-sugar transferase n=1 Tax=Mycotypha africana TaxID=64632 RepID=UPI00230028C6|nr:nucleotide-diphospho-sugar transferase [Mycotypha africana]KAI8990931.1 nucleotide-diphospho-sugar transferase [Mycotypha africana]